MRKWFTWVVLTNLAYVITAVIVAHNDSPTGYVFIAAMTFLTVGSMLYHAGVPRGNDVDVMGMYTVGLAVWVVTIMGTTVPAAVAMVALAVPGAYLLRKKLPHTRMELKVAVLFSLVYVTAFLFHGLQYELLLSVWFMGGALIIRKHNHGWWHVFSAIGLGLLWAGGS